MIRFEVADGANAGQRTRPYGGVYDTQANNGAGEFVSAWDPETSTWIDPRSGQPAERKPDGRRIRNLKISQQQLPFVTDFFHKVCMALGGRRSGKTAALGAKIAVLLIVFSCVQGCVLSPTYRQSKNAWKAVLRAVPVSWVIEKHRTERRITIANNASVIFLSADRDDSSRSEGCGWVMLDERQDVSEEAFSNAYLSASEGGGYYHISETATVKPELRPHHDKVEAGTKSVVYRMRSRGNPFISHDLFDDAEEMLDSETIAAELEAQWPDLFGRIFAGWDASLHVSSWPARDRKDATAAILGDRFDLPSWGDGSPKWYISIDPPGTAGLYKLYDDDTLHLVHEVLIGADGASGGIEDLARRVHGLVGNDVCVVVQDPHEHKWDIDVIRHFRKLAQRQFRFTSLRPLPVIYKHASVRARARRGKLLVDPRCPHAIEVLEKHQYRDDGSGRADKKQTYSKSHQRESKRIQLVHLGDVLGYGCYKLFPTKLDYEKLEKDAA